MELEIYNFPSQIWKFIPTPNGQQIVVELRDKITQSLHYQVIPSNISIPFEKGKYLGLAEVNDKIMLLHGYLRPEFPIRKGIWAYQLSDGKLAWEQTEMNFQCFDSNSEGIIVNLSAKPDIYLMLNAETGEILAENISISASQINQNLQNKYKDYVYSMPIKVEFGKSIYAEKLFEFTNHKAIEQIELISANNHTFIVYYTKDEGIIKKHIYISRPKEKSFFVCVNENVQNIQNENILYIPNKLILLMTDNQLATINMEG